MHNCARLHEIRYMKKTNTNTIITQAAPGSYIASDFSIKQGEKRKRIDAIRNRISHFDRRRISPIDKLAMNNRRLLIVAEFHFVHPVEKDS